MARNARRSYRFPSTPPAAIFAQPSSPADSTTTNEAPQRGDYSPPCSAAATRAPAPPIYSTTTRPQDLTLQRGPSPEQQYLRNDFPGTYRAEEGSAPSSSSSSSRPAFAPAESPGAPRRTAGIAPAASTQTTRRTVDPTPISQVTSSLAQLTIPAYAPPGPQRHEDSREVASSAPRTTDTPQYSDFYGRRVFPEIFGPPNDPRYFVGGSSAAFTTSTQAPNPKSSAHQAVPPSGRRPTTRSSARPTAPAVHVPHVEAPSTGGNNSRHESVTVELDLGLSRTAYESWLRPQDPDVVAQRKQEAARLAQRVGDSGAAVPLAERQPSSRYYRQVDPPKGVNPKEYESWVNQQPSWSTRADEQTVSPNGASQDSRRAGTTGRQPPLPRQGVTSPLVESSIHPSDDELDSDERDELVRQRREQAHNAVSSVQAAGQIDSAIRAFRRVNFPPRPRPDSPSDTGGRLVGRNSSSRARGPTIRRRRHAPNQSSTLSGHGHTGSGGEDRQSSQQGPQLQSSTAERRRATEEAGREGKPKRGR